MGVVLSREQRARALKKVRADYASFFKLTWNDAQPLVFEEFHRKVCDALMSVFRGETKRLMILAPPRSGKTKMVIHHFPVFYLGNFPKRNVISAAYSKDFATDAGHKVRGLINNQRVFPDLQIDPLMAGQQRFATTKGGMFFAVGRSSSLRGRGGDLILVDDAVKSEAEANSPRVLKSIHEWYSTDVQSRANSDKTSIIVINTRSAPNDLCGHLLNAANKGGDKWEVIKYPALLHEGTEREVSFSPLRHPTEHLQAIRKDLTSKHMDKIWHLQYMQRSVVQKGFLLHVDWLKTIPYHDDADPTYKYIFADFGTAAQSKHKTEFAVVAVGSDGRCTVIDWHTDEGGADAWVPKLVELFLLHKPMAFYGEAGIIRRMVEPYLVMEMRVRRAHTRLNWIASTRDKATRATPLAGLAADDKIRFVEGLYLEGDAGLKTQWGSFPESSDYHDSDKIDALSIFGQVYPELLRPANTRDLSEKMIKEASEYEEELAAGSWMAR